MKKKIVCALMVFSVLFCGSPLAASADETISDYDLGYVKGSFIIETGYTTEDEELKNVLEDLPVYEICLLAADNEKNVYFIRLGDREDHETAYEILKGAPDVLHVQLDIISSWADPSQTPAMSFWLLIETKYKWFDNEMNIVRAFLPECRIIKVESDLVNFYFIRSKEKTGAYKIYKELKALTVDMTVKINDSFNWAFAVGIICGDLDGDGEINATDYLILRGSILGITRLEESQRASADVNCDQAIDTTDILLMKRHILGIASISPDYSINGVPYETGNMLCVLFGHDFGKGEYVSVIKHNVRDKKPRCVEIMVKVHTCSRCAGIRSEVVSSQYIYCESHSG